MGFTTFSILDASRGLRQFFGVLYAFLGIFGSLALIVASIGIVNTLVMAILERRREIGIMKAIGASDGDVKKLFFAEAGAMGILAGCWRGFWMGHRTSDQFRNECLSEATIRCLRSISGPCRGGWSRLPLVLRLWSAWYRGCILRDGPLDSILCRLCATSKSGPI